MKAFRLLLGLVLVLGVSDAALGRPTDEASAAKSVVLRVEGMTCGGCATQIEAALKKIDGVSQVQVSYGKGEALVSFDPARVTEERLAAAVTDAGYKATAAPSCGTPAVAEKKADCWMEQVAGLLSPQPERLSDEQMAKLVGYLAEQVLSSESYEPDKEQIEKATGVKIPEGEEMRVQAAVISKLSETAQGRKKLDGGESRCADYGACSMHGNLNGATGQELETYVREKAEDGRTYEGVALPEFEAQALGGKTVRSTDLRGRPTLLVVMTGFCNHSIQSLPVLRETVRAWAPRGLRVVGIFANSGSAEELGQWLPDFNPEFEVWVKGDADFGDVVNSHMVPTYLYVDATGQIRKKFVGYHTAAEVQEPLAALVDSKGPSSEGAAGGR